MKITKLPFVFRETYLYLFSLYNVAQKIKIFWDMKASRGFVYLVGCVLLG